MLRRALWTLVVLMAMALATSSTFAAKPHTGGAEPLDPVIAWQSIYCINHIQTVYLYGPGHEFDPCPGPTVVNNPTGCVWDVDDAQSILDLAGSMETGQVLTRSFCAIADGTHFPPVDVGVMARHGLLVVRLDASDGRTWTAVPVRYSNGYSYAICARNFLPGPHPPVPDSNGGFGTLLTYTMTIDATARGGHNMSALLDYGQGIFQVGECH